VKRAVFFGLLAFLAGRVAFVGLDAAFPFPERGFERYGRSPRVRSADGVELRVGLTAAGERRIEVTIDEMSPHLLRAVVAQEDRRFFAHGGIDARALVRAALSNLSGRREGASTLSMQLARLAAPSPRTLAGKAVQLFRTLQVEARLEKTAILERYLNLAPFGGNLRGVGAASWAWFGKRAADLTAADAALLVSVLPSPSRFRPDKDPAAARVRRDRLLAAMGEPTDAPLGLNPTPFPDIAPHAWLQAGDGTTSIDLGLQRAVEEIARGASGKSVDGLAIVVLENDTRAIRALAGARRPSARVLDATRRPRSAGSTLKPLLYALALDLGLIARETTLLDLAWTARDWAPQNFARDYSGPVPAGRALRASYNLPAIRLAAALPKGSLVAALRRAGLGHLRTSGPAIDLAIGTDDVTAIELAGAYAALACGGLWKPPWLVARRDAAARVCSPGAAALVVEMLADPERHVVVKTGTSSRRRDAWAVGFTRRYTAVVWRGRLDGKPDASLVGAQAARPLLLEVLAAADPRPRPFGPPAGTTKVEVCTETGLAPTAACPQTRHDLRPADARPLRACGIHKMVALRRGRLCCARCGGSSADTTARAWAVYPAAWAHWRTRHGLAVAPLPAHDPDCAAPIEPAAARPLLLRPRPGQVLIGRRVVVRAFGKARLAVLLDGVRRATTRSGEPVVLDPVAPGQHIVTVLDGSRMSSAPITVR